MFIPLFDSVTAAVCRSRPSAVKKASEGVSWGEGGQGPGHTDPKKRPSEAFLRTGLLGMAA